MMKHLRVRPLINKINDSYDYNVIKVTYERLISDKF